MTKRMLTAVLTVALTLSLTACGGDQNNGAANGNAAKSKNTARMAATVTSASL